MPSSMISPSDEAVDLRRFFELQRRAHRENAPSAPAAEAHPNPTESPAYRQALVLSFDCDASLQMLAYQPRALASALGTLVDRFRSGAERDPHARLVQVEGELEDMRRELREMREALQAALRADAEFDIELRALAAECPEGTDDDEEDDFNYSFAYEELDLKRE